MAADIVAQALAGNIQLTQQFGSAFDTGMKIGQAAETAKMNNAVEQQKLQLEGQKLKQQVNEKTFDNLKFVTDPNTPSDLKIQAMDELNRTRASFNLPTFSDAIKNGIIRDKQNVPIFQQYFQIARAVDDPNNPASQDPKMIAQKQSLEDLLSTAGYSDLPMVIKKMQDYNKEYFDLTKSATSQQGLGDKDLLARASAARNRFADTQKQLTGPDYATSLGDAEQEKLKVLGDRYAALASGPPTQATVAAQEQILKQRDDIIQASSARINPLKNALADVGKAQENLSQIGGVGGMEKSAQRLSNELGTIQARLNNSSGMTKKEIADLRNQSVKVVSQAMALKHSADTMSGIAKLEEGLPKIVEPIMKDVNEIYNPIKKEMALINDVIAGKTDKNGVKMSYTSKELNQFSYVMAKAMDSGKLSDRDVLELGIGNNLDRAKEYIASVFGNPNIEPNEKTLKLAQRIGQRLQKKAEDSIGKSLKEQIDNGSNYQSTASRQFMTTGAGGKTMRSMIKRHLGGTDYDTAISSPSEVQARVRAANPKIKDPRIIKQIADRMIQDAKREIQK